MADNKNWKDIIVSYHENDRIMKITFNRPKSLNSFGGDLLIETIEAFELAEKDDNVVMIILTGNGRFFSSGADVKAVARDEIDDSSPARARVGHMQRFQANMEIMRAMIECSKVLVVAMNGPSVGAGAAWFLGTGDILLVAQDSWAQVVFSSLALVPENGSGILWPRSMGQKHSNEALLFGDKVTAQQMIDTGFANHMFPAEGFQDKVVDWCSEQIRGKSSSSLIAAKALINPPEIREKHMFAVYKATWALANQFVNGEPQVAFQAKRKELEDKRKAKL